MKKRIDGWTRKTSARIDLNLQRNLVYIKVDTSNQLGINGLGRLRNKQQWDT